MPLSIFSDALSYVTCRTLARENPAWQTTGLFPDPGYSSCLHWKLYCDRSPDERGVFVDWAREPEERKWVRAVSFFCRPLDLWPWLGIFSRKVLNRLTHGAFANIPYRFRPLFSNRSRYLFRSAETYGKESIFSGYRVISQDEGNPPFSVTLSAMRNAIAQNEKNLFVVFHFADELGHRFPRGQAYDEAVLPLARQMLRAAEEYHQKFPEEEILILSDHGMSTVRERVNLDLERRFGRQSRKTYFAYRDTAVLSVWAAEDPLRREIAAYLREQSVGHLLTVEERRQYGVCDGRFGDLLFILRDGAVFSDSWMGVSLSPPPVGTYGMHGFWCEPGQEEAMAGVLLYSGRHLPEDALRYPAAYALARDVMQGEARP